MRTPIGCIALALCLAAIGPLAGQAPPSTPTFKSRTNLVRVPVIVRDKQGHHVAGLSAADFTLQDNGKKYKIASMEEMGAEGAAPPPAANSTPATAPTEFSNFTATAGHVQQPLGVIIIAIDLVNTPLLDVPKARRAVLQFLRTQVQNNQPVGLVVIEPGRVRLLHAFTTSTATLTAALQRVTAATTITDSTVPMISDRMMQKDTPEILSETAALARWMDPVGREQIQEAADAVQAINTRRQGQGVATTLELLRQIATWVAGLPGRKTLIWATGQIPFISNPYQVDFNLKTEDYVRTMQALADANVAIYPVDVRGIVNPDFEANSSIYLGPGPDVFDSMRGVPQRADALRRGVPHLDTNHFAMNDLAHATGGQAFYNRNDIPKMFEAAVADSARYYMLSYYLDRQPSKPGWHKLAVTVSRPGVITRARSGFFFIPEPPAQSAADAEAQLALFSPFDYTALPLTLRFPGATAAGRVPFEVVIPPAGELVSNENKSLDLDFLAVATAGDGSVAGQSSKRFRATLNADSVQRIVTTGVTYVGDIGLKAGEYALRVVVRDNLSARVGSVTVPLKVQP